MTDKPDGCVFSVGARTFLVVGAAEFKLGQRLRAVHTYFVIRIVFRAKY